MNEQGILFEGPAEETGDLLKGLLEESSHVFVKKLSNNDRDWARLPNKHQTGVYIFPEQRDSGFFPQLEEKDRSKSRTGEAPIRQAFFQTEWPQCGEVRESRLVHYTSKGAETHLTGVPKPPFRSLAPASFFVIGKRLLADSSASFKCITIDSESAELDVLLDLLPIRADFRADIFTPQDERRRLASRALTFVEEAISAFRAGGISAFGAQHSAIPSTEQLAHMARAIYLKKNGLSNLNPYTIEKPGDAIREISRIVEYDLFKTLQLKAKSIELVRLVLGDNPKDASVEKVITTLISDFYRIDAVLLSAAQQRKSRAGYSFEHHIEQVLIDGGIPFTKQVVIEARKRPDFILPSEQAYKSHLRKKDEVLILSAKTTLRERWKQVQREINNCDLYLATVDENIASNAIEDMNTLGIHLVVPESLKGSTDTEYKNHSNVISFKTFFKEVRKTRMPLWENTNNGGPTLFS
jgi:hypothetical protein